ncbi:MAG: MOSC domain-containing protein [Bacteroidetes bacterium]|nr:MOSC domain-containing protein [Bacteroidota bacterium]
MIVDSIFIYPVKSLGGIELDECEITEFGLKFDRWWMLIDDEGKFLTQRQIHKLCLFKLQITSLGFEVNLNNDKLLIPFYEKTSENAEVVIWNDKVKASLMGIKYDKWFSERIGINCRLVRINENTQRKTDPDYAKNNELLAFSDAFQALVISSETIDDLNLKLRVKVPVNRFRPNIVIRGKKAFSEDEIKNFKINDALFSLVKPCARCIVPSINQETSVIENEIITELKKYRLFNGKILFGQNALIIKTGKIFKSSKVEIF